MSTRDADMIAAISGIEDDEDDGPAIPVPPATRPAQVYSVRIPVDRIEQLRTHAQAEGTTPSSLIRAWVIERLDQVAPTTNVVTIRRFRGTQLNASEARRMLDHVG